MAQQLFEKYNRRPSRLQVSSFAFLVGIPLLFFSGCSESTSNRPAKTERSGNQAPLAEVTKNDADKAVREATLVMHLTTAEEIDHENVTEAQLREAFRNDAKRGEFIILSSSEQHYIQAYGERDGPYELEYREGDKKHHFRAKDEYNKTRVEQAFVWYLNGDDRWRTDFPWEKMKF